MPDDDLPDDEAHDEEALLESTDNSARPEDGDQSGVSQAPEPQL